MAAKPNVVAAGPCGAGKSELLSVLADQKGLFQSGTSSVSLTQDAKRVPIAQYTLVDVPGSSGPDAKLHDQHHNVTAQLLGDQSQIFLLVMTPTNGRITHDDIAAYEQLARCFGAKPCSIVCVLNREPVFADEKQRVTYRDELKLFAEQNKIECAAWCFVPTFSWDDQKTVGAIRAQLLDGLGKAQAAQHAVQKERETAARLAKEQMEKQAKQLQELKAQNDAILRQIELVRQQQEEKERLEKQREKEREEMRRKQELLKEQERAEREQQEKQRRANEARLAELERQRQIQLELDRQAVAQKHREAEARRVAEQQELARQAAAAKAKQDALDNVTVWLRCDHKNGNPCLRTKAFTAKQVREGADWNCKGEGHRHHSPRVKGW